MGGGARGVEEGGLLLALGVRTVVKTEPSAVHHASFSVCTRTVTYSARAPYRIRSRTSD
jgi:hypothetical protein